MRCVQCECFPQIAAFIESNEEFTQENPSPGLNRGFVFEFLRSRNPLVVRSFPSERLTFAFSDSALLRLRGFEDLEENEVKNGRRCCHFEEIFADSSHTTRMQYLSLNSDFAPFWKVPDSCRDQRQTDAQTVSLLQFSVDIIILQ